MNPKMVILNSKEYQLKFDEAMACSSYDEHQKALNLLLELKQKRWKRFELFKMLAQEYIALGQFDQAKIIIKEIEPKDEMQKMELLELEQIIQQNMPDLNQKYLQQNKQNLDEQLFEETKELQLQKEDLKQMNQKQSQKYSDIKAYTLYQQGYYQSLKTELQALFGQNFSKIFSRSHQEKIGFLSIFGCFENYRLHLNLMVAQEENLEILVLKAYCYIQMKQYKLALTTLRKAYGFNQIQFIIVRIFELQYILGLRVTEIDLNKSTFQLSLQVQYHLTGKFFHMHIKEYKIDWINKLKWLIQDYRNIYMFLYRELFLMEYQISINSPILQGICDFLIKHAPRFSAGYAQQYQLFIDKKLMGKAFSLEQPLLQCEDCTLKFITLAKMYKEQQKFAQAHQALGKAKELNEFDGEIYQIKSDLFRIQKMYQQSYSTIRHLVQLERENYYFICQTIAPMIDKYEYYRVLDLLQLVDNESQKFDELKLLFRIISYKTDQEDEQILILIKSLDESSMIEFLGHYWLSKHQVKLALNYYKQIKEVSTYFSSEQIYIDQYQKAINQLKQLKCHKQHEITDFICQIGILNYKSSQDKSNIIHQRYINTIGFILTSIVYNESLEENIKIINSKYDMEVPKIKGFKHSITSIIETIYRQNYITSEKYQSYVQKGLSQLQILFTSTEVFMNSFYEFSDKYKQEMIQQFMESNHELIQIDEKFTTIYKIPFFADPISRYALVSVIKMIGYFTEFELVNNYLRGEEWFSNYMIKGNIEAYYKIVSK